MQLKLPAQHLALKSVLQEKTVDCLRLPSVQCHTKASCCCCHMQPAFSTPARALGHREPLDADASHAGVFHTAVWSTGVLLASLLPVPSARLLGVDSAMADASESESSSSSPDQHLDQAEQDTAVAARYMSAHHCCHRDVGSVQQNCNTCQAHTLCCFTVVCSMQCSMVFTSCLTLLQGSLLSMC